MKRIEFPAELAIFADRISDHWINLITTAIVKIQEKDSIPKLDDWYFVIRNLLEKEEKPPSILWALCSKIAWIQADIEFFINKSDFLIKEADTQSDSLLLSYTGAGITEFVNSDHGITIIGKGFSQLEASKDWPALFDVVTPYMLLLSNLNRITTLKDVYSTIKRIFEDVLDSNSNYQHLFLPAQSFAFKKSIEEAQIDLSDSIKIVEQSQHHLNTGLLYTLVSHKEEGDVFKRHLEAAIREYQLINANNRLIIAYTNFASYYASKAKHDEASEYLSKAFSLTALLSKKFDGGLSVYPLIQKAWLLVEQGQLQEAKKSFKLVLEKAKTFCCSLYQIKVEFGLAYVLFLESQDDLALTHAKTALSIVEESESKDPQFQNDFHLKYAELLIDLNKVDEIPSIFETIDSNNLRSCSKAYYHYIKGKYEFHIHNIGIAKTSLEDAMKFIDDCPDFRSTLLYTQAEIYLNEYRLSEDPKVLLEAQNMINESLEKLKGVPERTKGQCLLAIMLSAQGRNEEAEELLETLTTDSSKSIPRFRILAEKLLDNIHKSRVGSTPLSPITNIRDALRYLRDAKTLIDSQSR
ncbi:MAG: tetratricopeptide repeat protein [Candidatus Heimdallarchaeota archaeon]|nr:MAG: tetratricopeptide repeat protein [Candidatus Heimdallarchaeota archaeon]